MLTVGRPYLSGGREGDLEGEESQIPLSGIEDVAPLAIYPLGVSRLALSPFICVFFSATSRAPSSSFFVSREEFLSAITGLQHQLSGIFCVFDHLCRKQKYF